MPSHDNAGRQTDQREHNPEFLKAMTEWVEFGEQMKKQAIMDDYARMFISERRFVIREVLSAETNSGQGTIPESELYRRIYLAFRAAFCTLDETIDYDKAVEIIVHGEGENQHDLPGCEEEAGPNWNGEGEKGECPNCGKIGECDCTQKGYIDKPSPAPTREEWTLWAKGVADKMTVVYGSREEHIIAIQNALLSMPIIPKE